MDFSSLLQQYGSPLNLPKGGFVFLQGDANPYLYVVKKGLLKAFYDSENGKETVKSFIETGDVIGSLSAAYQGEACTFNLVCLEDSALIRISFDQVYRHAKSSPAIAAAMIEVLLALALKKERREYEFLSLSAEERYRIFRERRPHLLTRITQNDLARYLGITPVALSRIKGRMSARNSSPTTASLPDKTPNPGHP